MTTHTLLNKIFNTAIDQPIRLIERHVHPRSESIQMAFQFNPISPSLIWHTDFRIYNFEDPFGVQSYGEMANVYFAFAKEYFKDPKSSDTAMLRDYLTFEFKTAFAHNSLTFFGRNVVSWDSMPGSFYVELPKLNSNNHFEVTISHNTVWAINERTHIRNIDRALLTQLRLML
jgi:hypothetical protein